MLASSIFAHSVCGQSASAAPDAGPLPVLGLLLPADTAERNQLLAGVRLALSRRPGIVRLAVRGRRGPWGSAAQEAARLVAEDGADVLLGPTSGAASHLLLQVARKARRPVALLCADTSVTRTGVARVVRIAPTLEQQARLIFRSLEKESGPGPRWGLAVGSGRAARAASTDLHSAATAVGVDASVLWRVGKPLPAAGALRAGLAQTPVAAIFLALDPEPAGRLAQRLRDAGFAGVLAGPGRLVSPAFARAAGTAREGLLVTLPVAFASARVRNTGDHPAVTSNLTAALAHDATLWLMDELRRGRRSTADPEGPADPRPSATLTGRLRFDDRGNRIFTLALYSIRDGHLTLTPQRHRISETETRAVSQRRREQLR